VAVSGSRLPASAPAVTVPVVLRKLRREAVASQRFSLMSVCSWHQPSAASRELQSLNNAPSVSAIWVASTPATQNESCATPPCVTCTGRPQTRVVNRRRGPARSRNRIPGASQRNGEASARECARHRRSSTESGGERGRKYFDEHWIVTGRVQRQLHVPVARRGERTSTRTAVTNSPANRVLSQGDVTTHVLNSLGTLARHAGQLEWPCPRFRTTICLHVFAPSC
jgi:hypothetical protein